MKLDLRSSALVINGAWNPAILTWQWIAEHVMQIPDGDEITLAQASMEPSGKVVNYINGMGFCCEPGRLELYISEDSDEAYEGLSQMAVRIYEVLSHTPLGGIGFNSLFCEEDPDEDVSDVVTNSDNWNGLRVLRQEKITKFLFEEGVSLNYKRVMIERAALFDFNFHVEDAASILGQGEAEQLVERFKRYREWARHKLEEKFGLELEGVLFHEVSEGGADEQEV